MSVTKKNGLTESKQVIMIDMMVDPMHRLNELKKNERRGNQSSKHEVEKNEISYKWMEKFEEMHRDRMGIFEKMKLLESDVVRKNEQIDGLLSDLRKSPNIMQKLNELEKRQSQSMKVDKRVIHQQQQTIEKQRMEIRQLRKHNWRWKQLVHKLKKEAKVLATPDVKCENMYVSNFKNIFTNYI